MAAVGYYLYDRVSASYKARHFLDVDVAKKHLVSSCKCKINSVAMSSKCLYTKSPLGVAVVLTAALISIAVAAAEEETLTFR